MKKIAIILTIAFGVILWALNFKVGTVDSPNQTSQLFNFTTGKVELKEEEKKSIELPQINLPSIFEAIFRSI